MNNNITFPLGGIVIIDKVEKEFGLFSKIFKGIEGKMKNFIPLVKVHVNNKLTHSVSTHQILETYPQELFQKLGVKENVAERTLYRVLERIGKFFPVLLGKYHQFIKESGLADNKQIIDFSSTYFEGEKAEFASYGYSRDKRPDKMQINFGIATGINGIPTAITIQRGNIQDKKHMKQMLKIVANAGANTKKNKQKIRKMGYHYLTLKPKKVNKYRQYIQFFKEKIQNAEEFEINGRHYYSIKKKDGNEILYIFFCPELYEDQIKIKERKFEREKEKGNKILKKKKAKTYPSDKGWVKLIPHLQKTIIDISNPYIDGIEGFFILESSVDAEAEKILKLYKERDKAEKFIRNLKEGIELHPVRHWNKYCMIGIFFISFLAKFSDEFDSNFKQNFSCKKCKSPQKIADKFVNDCCLSTKWLSFSHFEQYYTQNFGNFW